MGVERPAAEADPARIPTAQLLLNLAPKRELAIHERRVGEPCAGGKREARRDPVLAVVDVPDLDRRPGDSLHGTPEHIAAVPGMPEDLSGLGRERLCDRPSGDLGAHLDPLDLPGQ
jgi:hypothetical protein